MLIYFYYYVKNSLLCDTKKLISLFVYDKFFIFNFYIANWEHVDLLRSGPRNKKVLIRLLLTCLMLRAALEKRCFYSLGLMFVKHL